jgi:hypothetical protein
MGLVGPRLNGRSEAALAVNDEQDFQLHTLIPIRDRLLAIFVKDLGEEMGG